MNVYTVDFKVDLSTKKNKWKSPQEYTKIKLEARDLNDVINKWPEFLLTDFPFEPGTGGSHYSEDPIMGDTLIFTRIEETLTNVRSLPPPPSLTTSRRPC